MGLKGMIDHLLELSDFELPEAGTNGGLPNADMRHIASALTVAERDGADGHPIPEKVLNQGDPDSYFDFEIDRETLIASTWFSNVPK